MFTIGASVVVSHPVNNAHSVFRHLFFFFFPPMAPVQSYHLFPLDLLDLRYWRVSVKRIQWFHTVAFFQYVLQVCSSRLDWLSSSSLLALNRLSSSRTQCPVQGVGFQETIHKRGIPSLWYSILCNGARLQCKVPFKINSGPYHWFITFTAHCFCFLPALLKRICWTNSTDCVHIGFCWPIYYWRIVLLTKFLELTDKHSCFTVKASS